MKSVFEAMGGTYRQCGDFFIPEMALPDTPRNPIGKYGRMRHLYLKGHRRMGTAFFAIPIHPKYPWDRWDG